MKHLTKKPAIVACIVAGTIFGTFGITNGYIEYTDQKTQVEILEAAVAKNNPETNWQDPNSVLWKNDTYNESVARWMQNEVTFYQDDVFDSPEWKSYEKLTSEKNQQLTKSTLGNYKQSADRITLPGLNKRADEAYSVLAGNPENIDPRHKYEVFLEASSISKNTESVDDAIEKASDWDFVMKTPNGDIPFGEINYNAWGLYEPTEEEKDIAREAIRQALVVGVEKYDLTI